MEDSLPKSPNKKIEVIGSLEKMYKIRIALSKKKQKYKSLSEKNLHSILEYMRESLSMFRNNV